MQNNFFLKYTWCIELYNKAKPHKGCKTCIQSSCFSFNSTLIYGVDMLFPSILFSILVTSFCCIQAINIILTLCAHQETF